MGSGSFEIPPLDPSNSSQNLDFNGEASVEESPVHGVPNGKELNPDGENSAKKTDAVSGPPIGEVGKKYSLIGWIKSKFKAKEIKEKAKSDYRAAMNELITEGGYKLTRGTHGKLGKVKLTDLRNDKIEGEWLKYAKKKFISNEIKFGVFAYKTEEDGKEYMTVFKGRVKDGELVGSRFGKKISMISYHIPKALQNPPGSNPIPDPSSVEDPDLENDQPLKEEPVAEPKQHSAPAIEGGFDPLNVPDDFIDQLGKVSIPEGSKFVKGQEIDVGGMKATYTGILNNEGKPEGLGALTLNNGATHVGRFIDGKLTEGKKMSKDQTIAYQGKFGPSGELEGKGIAKENGATYKGNFKSGKYDGYGILQSQDGSIIKGRFENGKQCGYGIKLVPNPNHKIDPKTPPYLQKESGLYQQGELINGTRELDLGDGVFYYGKVKKEESGKEIPEGDGCVVIRDSKNSLDTDVEFLYGEFTAEGRLTGDGIHYNEAEGWKHVGEFSHGNLVSGKKEFPDGSVKEGKFDGFGDFKSGLVQNVDRPEGWKYTGVYDKSKPNGKGTCTLSNGGTWEGNFKDGKPEGVGKYTIGETWFRAEYGPEGFEPVR